jgi:predicted DNA-binding ArsR family transcriptional regulator
MTKNSEIRQYGKECTISGKFFDANENNFYVNSNSSDGLHPYHKYYDNVRRSTGISVDKLREIINFKNQ